MENGSAPATKQEFEQLRSEMSRQYHGLVEQIARWETRLTEAFDGFAELNNARLIELDAERGDATQPSRYS